MYKSTCEIIDDETHEMYPGSSWSDVSNLLVMIDIKDKAGDSKKQLIEGMISCTIEELEQLEPLE